ncbi:hypothetical protein FA15DRAFT_654311 [Coprinopsis marcescibilis]|uniref:Uncharacterized protein n=1 Tax=Coprinopsis marcescibilis TaxID=230819 RepID=A0A5C3L195_COPMA|nr:hypothetical protein FA15DRAFT_654311 [Coprinopsis marcescibilis]
MQDIWDDSTRRLTFPLSDGRSEQIFSDPHSRPAEHSVHPPKASRHQHRSLSALPALTEIPVRFQVSPGVWTDGESQVYSSDLPEVQDLLSVARKTLVLPAASSDLVFTLAALEVFYKPGDPAHWLFWSDEKKNETADVVTQISLHRPPLIKSSVAWNGKPEYLSILANQHGGTWRQFFELEAWYTILVPPKPSTPPRALSLRKRKVLPGAFREPSRSPGLEDEAEELPVEARSSRNKKSRSPEQDDVSTDKRTSRSDAARSKTKTQPAHSLPLVSPSPSTRHLPPTFQAIQDMSPLSEIVDLDPEQQSTGPRTKRKINAPSRYPQPVTSGKDCSPTLMEASLLLGPAQAGWTLQTQAVTHNRNRSTSTDSTSAATVVQSLGSRSSSVSSALTAVETATSIPSLKRKAEVLDECNDPEIPETEIVEEEGTRTRGRTARAKKSAKGPDVEEYVATAKATKTASRSNRKKARKV